MDNFLNQPVPENTNMPQINCEHLSDKHIITILQENVDRSASYKDVSNILETCTNDSLPIHIDLKKVELISSAFIGTLMAFKKRFPDKEIVFINVNHTTTEIFRVTKLDTVIKILSNK